MASSASVDALASNVQASWLHATVACAFGGWFVATETVCVVTVRAPRLSVTVSVIVSKPLVAYECAAVAPVAVVPSPKLHWYDAIEPSGSDDADPSTLHASQV